VCAHTGWPLGHAFLTEASGVLAATGIWHADAPDRFPRFRAETGEARFAPGEGIAGRVLATGEAAWIEDVAESAGLVRASGREEGIRAVVAFPVRVGREVAGGGGGFSRR